GVCDAQVTPLTIKSVGLPAASLTLTSILNSALPEHTTGIHTPSTPGATPSAVALAHTGPAPPVHTQTFSESRSSASSELTGMQTLKSSTSSVPVSSSSPSE